MEEEPLLHKEKVAREKKYIKQGGGGGEQGELEKSLLTVEPLYEEHKFPKD